MTWKNLLLEHMLKDIQYGQLSVSVPKQTSPNVYKGINHGLSANWQIKNWAVVNKLLFDGEIGLGEAYMEEMWTSVDLTKLLTLLNQNEPYFGGGYNKNILNKILGLWQHRSNANTKKQAANNIKYHYDVGNDFYQLWLDKTMAYSSGIFYDEINQNYLNAYVENRVVPLELLTLEHLHQAQINKFEAILEKLNLNSQSYLLEIGSGWGGFAMYVAKKVGCKILSITLSQAQYEMATKLSQENNLNHLIEFKILDYRDLKGEFDGVVSVEMYEAVGEKYWLEYLNKINSCLKPNAKAVIQGITINPKIYDYYKLKWDFIQKYIFPGGMLCTPGLFQDLAMQANLKTENLKFFGNSYAQTLKIWQMQLDKNQEIIIQKYGKKFYLMWRYYLSYCESGFLHKKIDVMQITFSKYPYEKFI